MQRLNARQSRQLHRFVARLDTAAYVIRKAEEVLAGSVRNYNGLLDEVEQWRDGLLAEMDSYTGAHHADWGSGNAGLAFQTWRDEIAEIDLTRIPLPDHPDLDHAGDLNATLQGPSD